MGQEAIDKYQLIMYKVHTMPALLEALDTLIGMGDKPAIDILDIADDKRLDRQVAVVHFPSMDKTVDLGYPEQTPFKIRALQWRYPLIGLNTAIPTIAGAVDGFMRIGRALTETNKFSVDPRYEIASGSLEAVICLGVFAVAASWASNESFLIDKIKGTWNSKLTSAIVPPNSAPASSN